MSLNKHFFFFYKETKISRFITRKQVFLKIKQLHSFASTIEINNNAWLFICAFFEQALLLLGDFQLYFINSISINKYLHLNRLQNN